MVGGWLTQGVWAIVDDRQSESEITDRGALHVQRSTLAGRDHEPFVSLVCSLLMVLGVLTGWRHGDWWRHNRRYRISGIQYCCVSLGVLLLINGWRREISAFEKGQKS